MLRTSASPDQRFSAPASLLLAGAGFSPVTINTGNVVLTPGQQYVLFLTTSTITGQPNSSYRYGSTANTAYSGGQFVFQNNGTNFNQLSTNHLVHHRPRDLAFQAIMSAVNVGENHAQAQSGAFQLGNSYLSLLTDPFATNKINHDDGSARLCRREEAACRGAGRQRRVQGAAAGRRLYAALGRLGCGLRRRQQHAGR